MKVVLAIKLIVHIFYSLYHMNKTFCFCDCLIVTDIVFVFKTIPGLLLVFYTFILNLRLFFYDLYELLSS